LEGYGLTTEFDRMTSRKNDDLCAPEAVPVNEFRRDWRAVSLSATCRDAVPEFLLGFIRELAEAYAHVREEELSHDREENELWLKAQVLLRNEK
jgi:hypothetical protein